MFAFARLTSPQARISWDYEILAALVGGVSCFVASLSARHFEFPPAPNRGDANPNALGADPRSG